MNNSNSFRLICITILLFASSLLCMAVEKKSRVSSSPMNSEEKISFIKNTLDPYRKYQIKDNVELFQKILIGNWDGPPHAQYYFKENGEFEMINYEGGGKKEEGKYQIKGNSILLKLRTSKTWNSYELQFYTLEKNQEGPFNYTIYIKFKGMFYWADALVIDFN